jgi:hypothetical protein
LRSQTGHKTFPARRDWHAAGDIAAETLCRQENPQKQPKSLPPWQAFLFSASFTQHTERRYNNMAEDIHNMAKDIHAAENIHVGRLAALREEMKKVGIDAYMIPTADFHCSEYVAPCFKAREYFSGFTGSAGILIVMQDRADLWADGRYFIQAAKEIPQGSSS